MEPVQYRTIAHNYQNAPSRKNSYALRVYLAEPKLAAYTGILAVLVLATLFVTALAHVVSGSL
jgi:hypothetical protein